MPHEQASWSRSHPAHLGSLALYIDELLIANWRISVEVLFQAIRDGLDSIFIDWQHQLLNPHFHFLAFLVADFQGRPLDRTVYRFPTRDNPATYEAALQQWRTTDLDMVQRLVSKTMAGW
ncbi:MAG: hypothetical protein M0Z43_02800 [Acidithiobacillus sp.]|nr:hypothetical protein [Acidithiobacillus sp.]